MADGRFLSRRGSESHQLAQVSLPAAYLFTWCIPHLDVEGRMTGDPALVKAKAVPLRQDIPESAVTALLRELVAAELVTWYAVGGRRFLWFPGFHASQKGLRKEKEAPSRIPAPSTKGAALVPTSAGPSPTQDGPRPPEEKGREVEVQGEGKRSSVATQPAGAEQAQHPTGNGGVPRETPSVFAVLFPLVRAQLWRPDGKPPTELLGKPWSEDQEGTVIRELAKTYSVSDLEVVVLGLGNMLRGLAESERPSWLPIGAKASLRAVYRSRSGVAQMVELCRRAYWTVENKRPKKTRAGEPTDVAAILPGVLP